MTVVFVHGAPETAAVWDPLVRELGTLRYSEVTRLSPPGFGASLPADFGSTAKDYREWLVRELSEFDAPVDVVGHDWGGGHGMGVAMTHPELLRSWATDIIGAFEPGYVWHHDAQIWQTPGEGERNIREIFGATVADRAARMTGWGIPGARRQRSCSWPGRGDGSSDAHTLYRSTIQPALADIGRELPAAAARPGLVVLATQDQSVGSDEARRRGADRAGARIETFEGLGHWWMLQDPKRAAGTLAKFWASI